MSFIGRGWTKHSGKLGKRKGVYKEVNTDEWYCQACGDKQVNCLPAYMFESEDGEFIKICSLCEHTTLVRAIKDISLLIKLARLNTY